MLKCQTKEPFGVLITALMLVSATLACTIGSSTKVGQLATRTPFPTFTPTPANIPSTLMPVGSSSLAAAPQLLDISTSTDTPVLTPTEAPITDTPTPTDTSTATPTEPPVTDTPMPALSIEPLIASLSPKPEDCQPDRECVITAEGTWLAANARGMLQLHLLVRPLPDDPGQSYWVQSPPAVDDAGGWRATEVYIGQVGDSPGLPLRICVVATDQSLMPGQPLNELPPGPRACVDASRGSSLTAAADTPTTVPELPTSTPGLNPTPTEAPPPATPTPGVCQSFRPPLRGAADFPGQAQILTPGDCTLALPAQELITVGGTYEGIPEEADIWVLAYPHTYPRYFPQSPDPCNGAPTSRGDGKWQVAITLGLKGGDPEWFDILVVLTDHQTSQFLGDWLIEGCARGWNDFDGIPEDQLKHMQITEKGYITVQTRE